MLRGNTIMKGYLDNPEATDAAFAGGWFHTGDAAVVHPDGYVEIRDRLKDMIISGGENIYPAEVEAVLARHPAVADVAVLGRQDPTWGEAVHAVIIPAAGQAVPAADIIAWCRAHLAHGMARALQDVFNQAQKEADRLKDEYVSTEHLLLALAQVKSEAKELLSPPRIANECCCHQIGEHFRISEIGEVAIDRTGFASENAVYGYAEGSSLAVHRSARADDEVCRRRRREAAPCGRSGGAR